MSAVFVTGGTGYLGQPLIEALLQRDHQVTALARRQSRAKLPVGTTIVLGDALDGESYVRKVPRGATFVHLVGVHHPAPWKTQAFDDIDLASVCASLRAAQEAYAKHFVYVSVARPAPVMRAYQRVRAEAETLIAASGIPSTFIRPWYVLGPGHRWPTLLLPMYALARRTRIWCDTAERLRLVTRTQMLGSMIRAIEHTPQGLRDMEVADILDGTAGHERQERQERRESFSLSAVS